MTLSRATRLLVSFVSGWLQLTDVAHLANELVLGKAKAIEKSVYSANGGANMGYKSKIRSLFVNLKDKSNPNLRASIVDGSLAPERFTEMSSQVRRPSYLIPRPCPEGNPWRDGSWMW